MCFLPASLPLSGFFPDGGGDRQEAFYVENSEQEL